MASSHSHYEPSSCKHLIHSPCAWRYTLVYPSSLFSFPTPHIRAGCYAAKRFHKWVVSNFVLLSDGWMWRYKGECTWAWTTDRSTWDTSLCFICWTAWLRRTMLNRWSFLLFFEFNPTIPSRFCFRPQQNLKLKRQGTCSVPICFSYAFLHLLYVRDL